MLKKYFIFVLFLALTSGCTSPATSAATATPVPTDTPEPTSTILPGCARQDALIQQACSSPATGLKYWAYIPPATATAAAPLPLLLYLHGFSVSGSNLDLLLGEGVAAEIEKGRSLSMVVVSPQCPFDDNWQSVEMVERLSLFVDEVVTAYHLDPRRVYLTGFSMGGDGAWALANTHPGQFAALAPVSSDWYFRDQATLCGLSDLPIWVFQSQVDEVVSPKYAQQNIEQLQTCTENKARLTLFPDGFHEATAKRVYAMDELYRWFLEQR